MSGQPTYNWAVEPCMSGQYTGWMDMFYCVDPSAWIWYGTALSLFLSILGASW
jgi:hypothetical protein